MGHEEGWAGRDSDLLTAYVRTANLARQVYVPPPSANVSPGTPFIRYPHESEAHLDLLVGFAQGRKPWRVPASHAATHR